MKQDESIGQITVTDLIEGLRVNEALLRKAQGDREFLETRLAIQQRVIDEAHERMAELRELAQSAPQRIERLERRMAEQHAQLEGLRVEGRKVKGAERAKLEEDRNSAIARLAGRLAQGDMTVVAELQRLMKGT